jgi:hypothetical protein
VFGRIDRQDLARTAADSSIDGHNLQSPFLLTAQLLLPKPMRHEANT